MTKEVLCPVCKGHGFVTVIGENSISSYTCNNCNGSGLIEVPMTHADYFRAMSDEELVTWAHKQIGCGLGFFPCGVVCDGKCEAYDDETCKLKIMDWLKQPVEVE